MPRRSLGQHFLTDPSILSRIVDVAGVGPRDAVLEIGPGLGTLSSQLLGRGVTLTAVEKDNALFAHLQDEPSLVCRACVFLGV